MTLADYMRSVPRLNPNLPASLGAMYRDAVPITSPQGLRLTVLRLDPVVRQEVELLAGEGAIYDGYCWAHTSTLLLRPQDKVIELLVESKEGLIVVEHTWIDRRPGGLPPGTTIGTNYHAMLVSQEAGMRTYRCNNGLLSDRFDKLVFSLELVDVDDLSSEFMERAKRPQEPPKHSGRMVDVGGKRPVAADLVEYVGRFEQGDRRSLVAGKWLWRILKKPVSAEDVVRAVGAEEFVELMVRDELDRVVSHNWFRRSAVTGLHAMKSSPGTIVKLLMHGPYRDEEDEFEPGFTVDGVSLDEARRLFFGKLERA
jgi:hypothetical protein